MKKEKKTPKRPRKSAICAGGARANELLRNRDVTENYCRNVQVRKTLDKKRNAASQAIKDAFMTLRVNKQLPTLSNILELCGNEETMDIFCDTWISCVVGKVECGKRISVRKTDGANSNGE